MRLLSACVQRLRIQIVHKLDTTDTIRLDYFLLKRGDVKYSTNVHSLYALLYAGCLNYYD